MKRRIIFGLTVFFSLFIITTMSYAEEGRISSDNFFGCMDRDYYEKLIDYKEQNQMEAFEKGLVAGMADGRCTKFKTGDIVVIEDKAFFSGLIKVRKPGRTSKYWTDSDAVE